MPKKKAVAAEAAAAAEAAVAEVAVVGAGCCNYTNYVITDAQHNALLEQEQSLRTVKTCSADVLYCAMPC